MDEEADEATDDGAVDADELQVAPDERLDAIRRVLGVPALDRRGDEGRDLVAVTRDEAGRARLEASLHGGAQCLVVLEPVAEGAQVFDHPLAQGTLLVEERVSEHAAYRPPQGDRRVGDARVVEETLLDVLRLLLRALVVLQVVGGAGEEGVDACIDLAADMFEAIEPEPEGAEIKAVALQMIEERIDQISFGSLSAAIVFDRIPDEG